VPGIAAGSLSMFAQTLAIAARGLLACRRMLLRSLASSIALAVMVSVTAGACSSSGKRDQNYGKDAGTVYEPTEGGTILRDSAGSADRDAGAQDGSADGAGDATIDGETDADR
jgi:hypothetical protein